MIVDFHNHFLPPAFPDLPAGMTEPAWPSFRAGEGGGATLFVGDRPFRAFDDLYWDVDKRIAAMDAQGVDLQLISPLPEILSYWLQAEAAAILCRSVNAACAEMVALAPERLKGMAILPLQDVDAALRELEEVRRTPGLAGLFVGSNVNGASIAAERFDPVFAAAERLGLVVFVHGIRPGSLDRLEGPPLMGAVVGIPQENTLAVASFMMRDVLGRFPNLELVFSHGGGGIGAVLDRMDLVWSKFPAMREGLAIPPTEYARRFRYDTAVFGPAYVRYLADRLGADRLLAGTDGPTEIGEKDLRAFIARAGIEGAERDAICGGNAAALLDRARPSGALAA